MSLQSVSPVQTRDMMAKGARLIDVRSASEFAGSHPVGAENVPLGQIAGLKVNPGETVIFSCLSGARTQMHAGQLAAVGGKKACVMAGGLSGWNLHGLPVAQEERQPSVFGRWFGSR